MQGYNKFNNVPEHGNPQEVHVHSAPLQHMQPQQYMQPQPQQMTINEVEQPWGWGTVVMSVISFFCCQIFGLIAIVSSLTAYSDHRVKDYNGAVRKRNMARGFGIAAIVIGTLFVVGVIILVVKLEMSAMSLISGHSNDDYPTPSPFIMKDEDSPFIMKDSEDFNKDYNV